MKVVIAGTGNVAHVLGRKIIQSGHEIVQVVGRNTAHAEALGAVLHAPSGQLADIQDEADLYIVAVSDTALEHIGEWLPEIQPGIVVHTAGSVSKIVLKSVAENYGVLYPLQSLRSDIREIPEIPFLIDANAPGTLQHIRVFASSLSPKVVFADDTMRMKLHAGAVTVNNFTNYLFMLVQDFCEKGNTDFSLLLPLLHETVNRLEHYPARQMQTGPAMRNDQGTISKHLSLLQNNPAFSGLYADLSDRIARYYQDRKEDG